MRDLRTLDIDTINDFRCVVETFLVNSDFTPTQLEEVLAGVSLEFARAIGFDNHDIRECILETERRNLEILEEIRFKPSYTKESLKGKNIVNEADVYMYKNKIIKNKLGDVGATLTDDWIEILIKDVEGLFVMETDEDYLCTSDYGRVVFRIEKDRR